MIAHFKHIMDGLRVPAGEGYSYTEAGNGELGFYIVSDGTGRPYKVRCRPPCFYITSSLRDLLIGDNLADVVPTFGSLNMIGGECDR
jgi:NADH-quinone oxidoreductase subunit D